MPLGIAYREWLLELARAEVDAGCPRLFAMKSENATYFADLAEDWGVERRQHFLCARIKWLCTGNYGYPPMPVTEEEKAADAIWDYPWFGRNHGLGPYRSPGRAGAEFTWVGGRKSVVDADKVRALNRFVQREFGAFKIDRKLLRIALKEAMKPAFGAPVISGTGWSYVSRVAGLRVTTNLDFGGQKPSQLRYSQWVHLPKVTERDVGLLEHGGIGALLGWPQTEWCYVTNADIPAAAELLVRLCTEFVEAVPGMWERSGLGAEGGVG
ncbi:MAG: hypothetical protein ACRENE_23115 [Polyangiaceae bacterium]